MFYQRNKDTIINDNTYFSKNYNELITWINYLYYPLCQKVNNIDDLKDGDIIIDLLKNYFHHNNQKFYFSLINSLSQKNTTEKMKMILQIMSQLTTKEEIVSRIEMFQTNIKYFMENTDLIMELISYIKYLYTKNNINGYIKSKYTNNNNIKQIKSFSPLNTTKNSLYAFHRTKYGQKNIKNFYDFNKHRKNIVNDFANKKYYNKSFKSFKNFSCNEFFSLLDNKNKNDKKSIDYKFIKQNDDTKNKEEEINKNIFEIKSYKNRPKSHTAKQIQNFYNYKKDKCVTIELKGIKDKDTLNKSYKNNSINLTEDNQKVINTDSINRDSFVDKSAKKNNKFYSSSGELNNIVNYFKYEPIKPINITRSQMNIEKEHFKQDNDLNLNRNSQPMNLHIINNILGIFSHDKSLLNEYGEEELVFFRMIRPTVPMIFDDDKIRTIKIKNNEDCKLNENIKIKQKGKKNNINDIFNNDIENLINKNEKGYSSLENEKINYFSPKKEEDDLKYDAIKPNLINHTIQNSRNNIARPKSSLKNKTNNYNKLNDFDEIINPKRPRTSHSTEIFTNSYKNNDKIEQFFEKSNNSQNNNENNNNNKINKNDILSWLLDLNIIRKEEATIIILPQIVSDGTILCDIINKYEDKDKQIDGIIHKISSKEDALINIEKALNYLKEVNNFPKKYISSIEQIFEIDENTIWGLLYDLYEYYTKKTGYKKNNNDSKNENKYNDNKINVNNINNINNGKNEFLSRNNNKFNRESLEAIELKNFLNSNKNVLNAGETQENKNDKNNFNMKSKIYSYMNINTNTNTSKTISNSYSFLNHLNSADNSLILNKNINNNNNIIKIQNYSNNYYYNPDKKNLSLNYKINNKGYFDYVNDLKNHFDRNKGKKIIYNNYNNNYSDKKTTNLLNYSKDNQKPLYLNTKLHFNYNDKLNFDKDYKNYNFENTKNLKYNLTNNDIVTNKNKYTLDNTNGKYHYYY